jgi:type IV secretion system protein TrbL
LIHILLQVVPLVPNAAPPPLPPPANPVISDPSNLLAIYQSLIGNWTSAVSPYAYDLFYALAALELAAFGWNLWLHYGGDIRQALLMTANKILIIGVFLALLMNGTTWMGNIISMFEDVGKAASGSPGLSPSAILLQGFQIFGGMFGQATWHGLLLDIPTAVALLIAAVAIFASFLVISFQFLITRVQVALAIGMGYFFLGFGGSRWTTNYVERYFAYSVASGVKLMVLYMLVGAGNVLVDSWISKANAGSIFNTSASVEASWLIMAGSMMYAGVVWFSSSLVSQVFGGSPNLTHSDFMAFMAPAVSAGVTSALVAAGIVAGPVGAAGAAATAGGKAAAGAAGKAAGSSAGAAAAGAGGGASASGVKPSQPAASGARAAGTMAQVGASTLGRMPHGGSSSSAPTFNGFHH